jgi:anaerobic magnesium-protoporphyrin IX monomethyl ester cyclase
MKVSFISLGIAIDAIGLRILSSLLRQNGHQCQLLFLPTMEDIRRRTTRKRYSYSDRVIKQIIDVCRDSHLIGISLMTHHYSVAAELTQKIKESLSAPVIWGGIHPTVCPDECLENADMVCVGEAETSLLELAQRMQNGQDLSGIAGIWRKQNGTVLTSGAGPLARDLNRLPFPDYSFQDHYLLMDDDLVAMTVEDWHKHVLRFFPPLNQGRPPKPAYQVLSSRGCPYVCTFCGETPLAEKTYGRCYFRKRSIDNVIEELEWFKETFPFIGEICFCDDTFACRSTGEIREFAEKYKKKIDFPFYILVSPANVVKKKFDILVDAGLTHVGMGIQSGSQRIIDLYRRDRCGNPKQSLEAAKIINSYKDRLFPYYDFIVENPYETREDMLDTVRLLVELPRPFKARVYAISFFPGTPLFDKAKADGLFDPTMYEKTFGQRTKGGYLSFIIDMHKIHIPQSILRLLISKTFLRLLNKPSTDGFFLGVHQTIKWIFMKLNIHQYGLT